MQQHLSYIQLRHYFGIHDRLEISEKLLLVEELLLRYNHGSAFGKVCKHWIESILLLYHLW